MAVNIDDAYEVDANGLAFSDNNGNQIFYLATGVGSPVGQSAPINTLYINQSNQLIFYKFGSGNNDWRQLRAADIAFDNSVAQFASPATNVQQALEKAKSSRFQYVQFQFLGNMNFDSYLYSQVNRSSQDNRRSGDPSNGYQFSNSAPQSIAFSGNVKNATASIRGIAQSTGSPAANLELLFELWKVGFSGEGTKLGDIIFNIDTSKYTIGNFWNSSIQTEFAEEQAQDVDVTAGDLLGLKFIRRTGNSNVVAILNPTVVLEITGSV